MQDKFNCESCGNDYTHGFIFHWVDGDFEICGKCSIYKAPEQFKNCTPILNGVKFDNIDMNNEELFNLIQVIQKNS